MKKVNSVLLGNKTEDTCLGTRRELYQIKYKILLYLEENPMITAYQLKKKFRISAPQFFRKLINNLIYKKYVTYSDKSLKGKAERAKTYYLTVEGKNFLEATRHKLDIFFDELKPY